MIKRMLGVAAVLLMAACGAVDPTGEEQQAICPPDVTCPPCFEPGGPGGCCKSLCTSHPNTGFSCVNGGCSYSCDAGYANCNVSLSDGCETPLDTIQHCGSCGNACTAGPGVQAACINSVCFYSCGSGQTLACQ